MQVYPLMCVIDEVFEKKPSVAQQLFLVVDSDASGSVEIGEFMHLFRNVNLVVTKVKKLWCLDHFALTLWKYLQRLLPHQPP